MTQSINKAFLEMAAVAGISQEKGDDCAEAWKAAHGVDIRDPLPEEMSILENDSLYLLAMYSSLSSIKANRIVSGILSFVSHLAIVLGLTFNLFANSAWLNFQLRRPIFNSNPVMLSIWSICMRLSNLNPCHWQFVTNRVPISDILSCDFYLDEKSNSCSHLWCVILW